MAVGITSFAALAIVGLIPVGLNSFHQTKLTSTAAAISKQIFSEVGNASFSSLVVSGSSSWRLAAPNSATGAGGYIRYFDDQGDELAATDSSSAPSGTVYETNTGARYAPQLSGPTTTSTNYYLLNVTVQVAYNPGNAPMDFMTSGNATSPSWVNTLWAGTANGGATRVPMYNFQTMVAGDPNQGSF